MKLRGLVILLGACLNVPATWVAASPTEQTVVCAPAAAEEIALDGLLDEWKGIPALVVEEPSAVLAGRPNWHGAADASFRLQCVADSQTLWLAIDAQDDAVVIRAKERFRDYFFLSSGAQRITIYPGNLEDVPGKLTQTVRPRKGGSNGALPQFAEAMSPVGFHLEVAVPWSALPRYRTGLRSLPILLRFEDSDAEAMRLRSTIGPRVLTLRFAQQEANLDAVFRDLKASPKEVRWQQQANVVGSPALEQLLLLRNTLVVAGTDLSQGGYLYLNLPVSRSEHVFSKDLADLDGDGRKEILLRYRQQFDVVEREFLAVYHFDRMRRFVRPLLQETRQSWQGSRIENRLRLVPRKGGGRRATDIVVDQPKATATTAGTYNVAEINGVMPILKPWEAVTRRRYQFSGDEFSWEESTLQ